MLLSTVLQVVIVLFDVGELEREILQHHMRDLIRDRPYCLVLEDRKAV